MVTLLWLALGVLAALVMYALPVLMLVGTLIVLALVNQRGFARFASGRVPMFLGRVSFAVYLVHLAILASLGVGLFDVLFQQRGWSYDAAAWTAALVALIASYGVATLFHALVDAPAITLSNRIRDALLPRAR